MVDTTRCGRKYYTYYSAVLGIVTDCMIQQMCCAWILAINGWYLKILQKIRLGVIRPTNPNRWFHHGAHWLQVQTSIVGSSLTR